MTTDMKKQIDTLLEELRELAKRHPRSSMITGVLDRVSSDILEEKMPHFLETLRELRDKIKEGSN